MILSDTELRAALDLEQLRIDPRPSDEDIQPSAIDLHLADEFKVWNLEQNGGAETTLDLSRLNFSWVAHHYLEDAIRESDGSVILKPKAFLLAKTKEVVGLPQPSRLAARVEGRSSLARLGIGIHVTAPTIHATFSGQITLEITNHGSFPVKLREDLGICQLIVESVYGTPTKSLKSVFQNQNSVVGRQEPDK